MKGKNGKITKRWVNRKLKGQKGQKQEATGSEFRRLQNFRNLADFCSAIFSFVFLLLFLLDFDMQ